MQAISQTSCGVEETSHKALYDGAKALMDADVKFFENVVRPLYKKNTIVQIAFHALVPMFGTHLQDAPKFNASVDNITPDDRTVRETAYKQLSNNLVRACEVHATRCKSENITAEMVNMRLTLETFSKDLKIYGAFELLYLCSKAARVAWSTMMPRIIDSLENDRKIEDSVDLPPGMLLVQMGMV